MENLYPCVKNVSFSMKILVIRTTATFEASQTSDKKILPCCFVLCYCLYCLKNCPSFCTPHFIPCSSSYSYGLPHVFCYIQEPSFEKLRKSTRHFFAEMQRSDIQRTVHHDTFVKWKPTRCTNSQLYFDLQLNMFRTDLLSTIRSLNAVFTAIGVCSILTSLADSQHNQHDKYQLL